MRNVYAIFQQQSVALVALVKQREEDQEFFNKVIKIIEHLQKTTVSTDFKN